ncbi:hypothetical protein Q3G72_024904 [Acer saccharum]|nr:hypothetical protein Q3G72_024904 [Acer saccharum]
MGILTSRTSGSQDLSTDFGTSYRNDMHVTKTDTSDIHVHLLHKLMYPSESWLLFKHCWGYPTIGQGFGPGGREQSGTGPIEHWDSFAGPGFISIGSGAGSLGRGSKYVLLDSLYECSELELKHVLRGVTRAWVSQDGLTYALVSTWVLHRRLCGASLNSGWLKALELARQVAFTSRAHWGDSANVYHAVTVRRFFPFFPLSA